MDTALDTQPFGPIADMHRRRTARIAALTPGESTARTSTGSPAFDYCAAHHYLEGAEAAGRARDRALFAWYNSHQDADAAELATGTAVGPRVLLSPPELLTSPLYDSPYYVLGPDSTPAHALLQDLARAAFADAARAGFGDLLADHAVVVVLLQAKGLTQILNSWTISRLPGTVFTDYTSEAVILARDLVHEAGHNWLNDAFAATRTKISDTERFHSPWKGTHRPAFGFLHACWSFPLTMLYAARALQHTQREAAAAYMAAYLAQQRPLLASTRNDHEQALYLVTDDELRERLRTIHHQALAL